MGLVAGTSPIVCADLKNGFALRLAYKLRHKGTIVLPLTAKNNSVKSLHCLYCSLLLILGPRFSSLVPILCRSFPAYVISSALFSST